MCEKQAYEERGGIHQWKPIIIRRKGAGWYRKGVKPDPGDIMPTFIEG